MYNYYQEHLDDGSLPTDHFEYCANPTDPPFSSYNEVEVYKYNSGQWDGPYVYFAESMPWIPNWNNFYTSVWSEDLDKSQFDMTCYTNMCDQNICPDNEFCRVDWPDWSNGGTKEYYCCPSESSELTECHEPGYFYLYKKL